MWLLFHRKAGSKVVPGGRTFVEHCPTCNESTKFREIELNESFGVWFVDVLGDKERKFRCDQCQDVFDLRDQSKALPEQPKPLPDHHEERARIANKIEDELAELKRRLGK